MLLTAIVGHDYRDRWRFPGDTYEAENPTASALVLAGVCKHAERTRPAPAPQPEQIPIVAVDETTKRKYQRRDMVPVK